MSDEIKLSELSVDDIALIKSTLDAAGYPEPSDITLIENVLRYVPNCDDRDATLGLNALEDAGLNIAYDGDSSTSERGIDQDTTPPTVVVMISDPVFDPAKVKAPQ